MLKKYFSPGFQIDPYFSPGFQIDPELFLDPIEIQYLLKLPKNKKPHISVRFLCQERDLNPHELMLTRF